MAEINGIKVPFVPILERESSTLRIREFDSKFGDILSGELSKVRFSNHASKRLEDRNINLSLTELNKIEDAVQRAELKGAKDSLVMMNGTAFIINIPNKTVVTAMPLGSGEDVFTNIDSVVFT